MAEHSRLIASILLTILLAGCATPASNQVASNPQLSKIRTAEITRDMAEQCVAVGGVLTAIQSITDRKNIEENGALNLTEDEQARREKNAKVREFWVGELDRLAGEGAKEARVEAAVGSLALMREIGNQKKTGESPKATSEAVLTYALCSIRGKSELEDKTDG